jgi:hypothetical protein
VSLGIFLKVLGFSEYFWCFKTITRFFWNCFHMKNKFEKKSYPILKGQAHRLDALRPAAARLSSSGPRPRPWPVSMADTARSPGRRRRPSSASVPCTTRSAPYLAVLPQVACALTLAAAALRRLRKTPPPEPQARHRPSSIRRREARPGEAAATRSFTRSSCASSASSRRQSRTGVPPPSRATTGRPCSPSPAACRLSPSKVSTPLSPPRAPLRFPLLTRAPGSLGRRRRHSPRPPRAPCPPWTDVGDDPCSFACQTLRNPLIPLQQTI